MTEMVTDEILEYQSRYVLYIIVHDAEKNGSAVKGYDLKDREAFSDTISRCNRIAESPIQVVRVGGPTALSTYAEYAPYTIVEDDMELVRMVVEKDCPGEINPYMVRDKKRRAELLELR